MSATTRLARGLESEQVDERVAVEQREAQSDGPLMRDDEQGLAYWAQPVAAREMAAQPGLVSIGGIVCGIAAAIRPGASRKVGPEAGRRRAQPRSGSVRSACPSTGLAGARDPVRAPGIPVPLRPARRRCRHHLALSAPVRPLFLFAASATASQPCLQLGSVGQRRADEHELRRVCALRSEPLPPAKHLCDDACRWDRNRADPGGEAEGPRA